VDRGRGLSARLKLTLSYAGFLMLASALMLAAIWVSLLRYIPDGVVYGGLPGSHPTARTP
jgi:two-component system, OmpR family, sensor histidine kinase VanS